MVFRAFSDGMGGFPTATNYILHIAYLESIVVFIVGVVKTVKNEDTNGIYILPKLIAFILGCAPLAVAALVRGLPDWMLAGIISDILYGIMKLLIDILPDVGFHARHFNIPSIIGAVVGIILIASVCNFTGKQMAKRTRAKA